jgi:hypothetical protein
MNYNDIIIEDIIYKKPRDVNNYSISKILYDNKKLIIQTPILQNKTGICIKNNKTAYIDFEINEESNLDFYNFLCNINKNNINQVYQNSIEWFSKQFPIDIITDYTISILNNNLIRCFIPIKDKKIKLNIRDSNDIELDISHLLLNLQVSLKITMPYLKFYKNNFKLIMEINEFKIHTDNNIFNFNNFNYDSDNSDNFNNLNNSDNELNIEEAVNNNDINENIENIENIETMIINDVNVNTAINIDSNTENNLIPSEILINNKPELTIDIDFNNDHIDDINNNINKFLENNTNLHILKEIEKPKKKEKLKKKKIKKKLITANGEKFIYENN